MMANQNTEKQHKIKDPCQMTNFDFDAPIKVSVILEETELDELNASLAKKTNNSISIDKERTLNTIERDTPNENNILNNTNCYCEHYRTTQQAPDNINDKNKTKSLINGYSNNGQTFKFPDNIDTRNIINMIDSVSYKIIDIWIYYHNVKLYMKTYNNFSPEVATRNFIVYKYSCYNCSFSNINVLILPLAQNHTFIDSFMKRTALIARNMNIQIPHEFISEIIGDMLNWSKQYKINLQPHPKNKKTMKSSENKDKICIFNLGPEDRKITISVAPEVLTKHLAHSKTVEDTHINKQKEQANSGDSNILAHNTSCSSNNDYYNLYENRNPRTNTTLLENVSTSNVQQERLLNPVLLDNDSETYNLLIDDANNQKIYPISRSISRDSGCVSLTDRPPSLDSVQAGVMDAVNDNVITQTIHREEIKSPHNKYILYSPCCVCSLQTHRACLGCSREFYCSVECQKKDWPRHAKECRL